jgi:hypothetical protein
MPLPQVPQVYHRTKLLSTGQEIKLRPFTVGEQKSVMLVRETMKEGQEMNIYKAIVDLVSGCIEGNTPDNKKIDVYGMYQVEFEKLFYDLRSISDGDEFTFTIPYKKDNDEKDYTCEQTINIQKDLVLVNENNFQTTININKQLAIKIRQVKIKDLLSIENFSQLNDVNRISKIINLCIEAVINGEEVLTQFAPEEIGHFIDQLPDVILKKISKFFENTPALICTKEFMCPGKSETVKLSKEDIRSFLS